jgi:hypothetical protein
VHRLELGQAEALVEARLDQDRRPAVELAEAVSGRSLVDPDSFAVGDGRAGENEIERSLGPLTIGGVVGEQHP